MTKIIHIIPNDKKFVNPIICLFANNKNTANTFIVVGASLQKNNNNIYYKTHKELFNTEFINTIIQGNDIIIFHSLLASGAKLISKIDFIIKIIWASWGGDFYHHNSMLKANILEPKTKALEQRLEPFFKEKIIRPLLKLIYPQRFSYYWQKKAIKNITYIAPVIYDDYELIKKYYKAPHLKYLDFSVGNLEDDLLTGININEKVGNNILLGNSSSFTNNHIEAIEILSDIDLQNNEVITPLSYGNTKLKDAIIKYANNKLPNNFKALVDFINPAEYHKLLVSCGFVIMNHKRQQGVGNIVIAMYLGAKIFLNKQNPVYDYFKRLGAYVFLIDEIIEKKEKAFVPLTQEQININREILVQTRSKKVVDGFIQKIAEL